MRKTIKTNLLEKVLAGVLAVSTLVAAADSIRQGFPGRLFYEDNWQGYSSMTYAGKAASVIGGLSAVSLIAYRQCRIRRDDCEGE